MPRRTLTGAGRGPADLALGSWRRTLLVAVAMAAIFAGVVAAVATFGDLSHTSFPGHPYPPAGYYRNPFSTDPGDLVSAADAARVRASFQADGAIELDAFARGDATALPQADAGGRLATLQRLVEQNNAAGTVQRYDNHIDGVVVGRLAAPGSSTVTWSVEERGTATLTDISRADGRVVRTQRYRFDGRFWLARAGDRYVITDASIVNTLLAGG
jgi:hypothetical protein